MSQSAVVSDSRFAFVWWLSCLLLLAAAFVVAQRGGRTLDELRQRRSTPLVAGQDKAQVSSSHSDRLSLPFVPDSDRMMISLTNMLFDQKVQLQDVVISEESGPEGLHQTHYSLALSGSYQGLKQVLAGLLSAHAGLVVDSVAIKNNAKLRTGTQALVLDSGQTATIQLTQWSLRAQ